jgi:hypothetical protein
MTPENKQMLELITMFMETIPDDAKKEAMAKKIESM